MIEGLNISGTSDLRIPADALSALIAGAVREAIAPFAARLEAVEAKLHDHDATSGETA